MLKCILLGIIVFGAMSAIYLLLQDREDLRWQGILVRRTILVECILFLIALGVLWVRIICYNTEIIALNTKQGQYYAEGKDDVDEITDISTDHHPSIIKITFTSKKEEQWLSYNAIDNVILRDGTVKKLVSE